MREKSILLQWNPGRGNELLVTEVLGPLLDIIYLYKESQSYNYVPGTTEDCDAGWNYFENRFHDIYRALNQNLYISHGVYLKVLRIIEEMQCFVRKFSGAEGLAERYFAANPNLRFFTTGFQIWEEDEAAYEFAVASGALLYVPAEDDFVLREAYFAEKRRADEKKNFQHDTDDFFVMELAYALRLIFLTDLAEYAA